uniref:Uncharacterized protein n=1 Tax=mine drainage metagenome TaxID=410659 RepID=E6QQ61_9ZZZZ
MAPRPGLEPGTCGLTVEKRSLIQRGFQSCYQLNHLLSYTVCFAIIPLFTGYGAADLQQKIMSKL